MQKLHRVKFPPRAVWLVAIPAAVAAVAVALAECAGSAGFWFDVAWTSAAISALIGALVARRAASGPHRSRWTLWAAATGCWLFGQMAWNLFGIIGTPASPNAADVGWWMFAVLVMLSIVRTQTSSRALRTVAIVEVLPVIAGAAALTFAELWHDVNVSMLATAPRMSALIYPTLYVSAAVLALQALLGGAVTSIRSVPSRLALGGIIAQAFSFIMWSEQLLDQHYVPGATVLDPIWVLGLIAIGAGGALACARPEPDSSTEEPGLRGGILPAGLFLLLMGALVRCYLDDAPDWVALVVFGGLLCSGATLAIRGTLL